jgi:hypothetical protein
VRALIKDAILTDKDLKILGVRRSSVPVPPDAGESLRPMGCADCASLFTRNAKSEFRGDGARSGVYTALVPYP